MSSTVARLQVYLIVEIEIETEIERLQEREVRNGVMAFLKLSAGRRCLYLALCKVLLSFKVP